MFGNQVCSLYITDLLSKIVDIVIKQHGFEDPQVLSSLVLSQDEIISSQATYIFKIGSIMLLITLIGVVLTIIYNYIFSKISSKVSNNIRKDLYKKIMRFYPYDFNGRGNICSNSKE